MEESTLNEETEEANPCTISNRTGGASMEYTTDLHHRATAWVDASIKVDSLPRILGGDAIP